MDDRKYKIALMTAHIGNADKPELTITPKCKKELDAYGVDIYRFNNANIDLLKPHFTPIQKKEDICHETLFLKLRFWYNKYIRYRQKTYPSDEENYNRLIAKLPKMQFYKFVPNVYDYFIWCDSKFTLEEGWLGYILNLIEENGNSEMIVSLHGERNSILEEFNYMKYYMIRYASPGLVSKYDLAKMEKQIQFYLKDKSFTDNKLYELPLIIYSKDILNKKLFLEEWYLHNYFFTIQDQLSLPYVIHRYNINVHGVKQDVFNTPFVRHNHY